VSLKPLPGLDENGVPYRSPTLSRRILALPLVLVLSIVAWPCIVWQEYTARPLVRKLLTFPLVLAGVVAISPVNLWREYKVSGV
jgi:hypothetical protein